LNYNGLKLVISFHKTIHGTKYIHENIYVILSALYMLNEYVYSSCDNRIAIVRETFVQRDEQVHTVTITSAFVSL